MNIYLHENIKRLSKAKDITQETLADFLGISFQAVSKWERGESLPDVVMLPVIANYFGVTIDELMGTDKIRTEENEKKKEEEFLLFQKNMIENVWHFMWMIDYYYQNYSDFLSSADRLAVLKINADLTDVIYAGDDNIKLAKGVIYEDMARLYFSIGDKENGYLYLEIVVDNWINWFTLFESQDAQLYKSPLFNRLKWNKPQRNAGTNIYLNNLKTATEYDCVREEERFKQCILRLEDIIKL
ncbi:MAG: helix-turn-helix domain-containing protein [Oscillospiraceae bacterium]|nr:helix-turn-helix domain-containing protein [Oscillospiraceae bacterium]